MVMHVQMKQRAVTASPVDREQLVEYLEGEVYEVDDHTGRAFVTRGWAQLVQVEIKVERSITVVDPDGAVIHSETDVSTENPSVPDAAPKAETPVPAPGADQAPTSEQPSSQTRAEKKQRKFTAQQNP